MVSIASPEPSLGISGIQAQLGFLMGKVLTIAEAVHTDKEQRKAVKDIIRAAFREQSNHFGVLAMSAQNEISHDPSLSQAPQWTYTASHPSEAG